MEVSQLNEERKRQKISVEALAKKANLPKGTVEKVLFGVVQNPRIDTMRAIEQALGLSPSVGITEEDRAAGAEETMTVSLSAPLYEWVEIGENILESKGEEFFESLIKVLNEISKN